ncbi:MAG: MFS transporter [Bacillota bacterium]
MLLRTVIIIVFCFQLILNMTRPIIPLQATGLGASTFEVGLLAAAYAFLPLFLAIRAGKIADRIGDRLPVMIGHVGVALGMALPGLIPSMWSLFVSQVIVGVAHIFIVISLQNVLGNSASPEKRDHYFSMFSTFVSIAAVIGPVTGGYLAEYISYPTVFLLSLVVSIFSILFSVFLPHEPRKKTASNLGLMASVEMLKMPILRKALIASALALYSRDIFVAYFPLYGQELGMTATTIGWILSLQGFMMVAVRLFLTKLTDQFGRENVLVGSVILAGASFMLVPFTHNFYLIGLWASLMGIGLGSGQPLSMATTYNASPKSRTGEVLGLRLSINRVSQLLAPLFFGVVGASLGLLSVFFISGAFLIGGTWAIKPEQDLNTSLKVEKQTR